MRYQIVAFALVILAFVAPRIADRLMSEAPEIVWRILSFVLTALAVVIFLLSDWPYRRLSAPQEFPYSSTLLVILSGAALFGSAWWFFVVNHQRVDFAVTVRASTADRPTGTDVYGIKWRPSYSEVVVTVRFGRDGVYEDLDLTVGAGIFVAGFGQITGPAVEFQTRHNPTFQLQATNPNTLQSRVLPFTLIATDGGYRVACDKLKGRTRLEFVLAAVRMSNQIPTSENDRAYRIPLLFTEDKTGVKSTYHLGWEDYDERVFGPKRIPDAVSVVGTYRTGNRKRSVGIQAAVIDPFAMVVRDWAKRSTSDITVPHDQGRSTSSDPPA